LTSKIVESGARVAGKTLTESDAELFEHVAKNLYTAVLSDSLDELGFRDQVMREMIRPLSSDSVAVGWARTVLCMDVHYTPDDPYGTEIEAIDSILPGEVVVVSTGFSKRNAPWGELLSTAAVARGARGCITDGLIRDTRKILEMGFAMFSAGIKPVDSRGRGLVVDYNLPADCGGVVVNPGDLVVADFDGVVVVPNKIVPEAVRLATDKVTRENQSRKELMDGAYLRDVFDKYGVL
jgi:4-hydroxy-4-methyl-2-oxoglutarate aldolase